ncbi:MAG: DUF4142 domain-containing protein [Bacteroidia bacterium]|nr:DUF4142 domain-containing protein [Bacteroidia bacterium]
MKNSQNFKYFFIIAAAGAFASCSNAVTEDTKNVANLSNEITAETDSSFRKADAKLLVNAAELSLAEVQLAQLAQTSNKSVEVRVLAKKIEDTHNKLYKDLELMARKNKIEIPNSITPSGMEAYNILNTKSKKEFNSSYCTMTASNHQIAINLYEKIASTSKDTSLVTWAGSVIPELRANMDEAQVTLSKIK